MFFDAICLILILLSIMMACILLWALVNSIKPGEDFETGNVFLWPNFGKFPDFRFWDNFLEILTGFGIRVDSGSYYSSIFGEITYEAKEVYFPEMLFNTIIYASVGAIFQSFLPAIVAYTLCKYKFKFSKFFYGLALIVYIIPIVGNFPAMITLMRDLGIYNTLWGSFIQKFNFFGMYFFVFYAYFENYSDSYLEAAEMDGANQFVILFKIVLPMASKLILTVLLISFVSLWNDYQTPLLYMPSYPTLAYGIYKLVNFSKGNGPISHFDLTVPLKMAGAITVATPIVVLFIFLKEKLMSNISLGGVKE